MRRYPFTIYSIIGAVFYVAGYFFNAAYDARGIEGALYWIGLLFQLVFMMIQFVFYVIVNVFGLNTHGDTLVSLSIFVGLAVSFLIDRKLVPLGRNRNQKEV